MAAARDPVSGKASLPHCGFQATANGTKKGRDADRDPFYNWRIDLGLSADQLLTPG
jgi:hypothetical protein